MHQISLYEYEKHQFIFIFPDIFKLWRFFNWIIFSFFFLIIEPAPTKLKNVSSISQKTIVKGLDDKKYDPRRFLGKFPKLFRVFCQTSTSCVSEIDWVQPETDEEFIISPYRIYRLSLSQGTGVITSDFFIVIFCVLVLFKNSSIHRQNQ